MTKSAKITTIALIGMFTVLSASNQRISALGGNAGFWPGDDANMAIFPATINDFNIAQISGVGAESKAHTASVLWGDGTKYGFSWDQSASNDMINLRWGNGSMGLLFGLSSSAEDDGVDDNGKATGGMGLDIGFGMNMDFGELGVGFSTSSYDDGVDGNDDPSKMGLSVNLRRPQSLWIFDNMLVGFEYNSFNAFEAEPWMELDSDWTPGVADAITTMDLTTSLYTHVAISDNTTGLIAMGFGYTSHANGSYGGAMNLCDGNESEGTQEACEDEDLEWREIPDHWTTTKDAASSWISLPNWTFAIESAMTDWATARVGVNAGYNLSSSTEQTGLSGAKATTGRGGSGTTWAFGLGFNYGSFSLDVDITEDLYTNPVQHVVGYENLGGATATMTYTW